MGGAVTAQDGAGRPGQRHGVEHLRACAFGIAAHQVAIASLGALGQHVLKRTSTPLSSAADPSSGQTTGQRGEPGEHQQLMGILSSPTSCSAAAMDRTACSWGNLRMDPGIRLQKEIGFEDLLAIEAGVERGRQ